MEITLAQANKITQSRYDFSVVEKRAVYFIIREVRKQFVIHTNGQKTLYENLVVRMKTADLQKTDSRLEDIYKGLITLRKKSIFMEDSERAFEVGYINYFEHKKHIAEIEVEVSKKILPYLVELAKEFTEYYLTVALSLKNKYSQRFYEFCSQWKSTGFFVFTINELREKLMLEEKYPRYALLKTYVIESAQKELKELYDKGQCNLHFTFTEEKCGRSIERVKFFIKTIEDEKAKASELKSNDYVYYIRTWLESWLSASTRPKNKAWINLVISTLSQNPENLKKCHDKLVWVQKHKDRQDYAPYSRAVIEDEFL